MTSPNITLKLCEVPKKVTPATIYHAHFLEILDSFPDAIPCFTDVTKIGDRIGFAFSIGNNIFSYHHRNFVSVTTAELRAIFQCLESILSLPSPQSNTFLVASDSLSALTVISTRPLLSPSSLANPYSSLHPPIYLLHHNLHLGPKSKGNPG